MSKRSPYVFAEDRSGQKLWRSLAELEQKPELIAQLPAEFPPNITEPPDGMSRRTFFNLMGASAALAGLAACRSPDEKIVPYAQAPEEQIPGAALYYATATTFGGTAIGLIVESHDGRPTKLEGNPAHPDSAGGGLVPWVQASVLDLYDPDRSQQPRQKSATGDKFEDRTWSQATDALKALGQKLRGQGARFVVLTGGHRSPTLQAQLDALKAAMPGVRIVRWEPVSRDAQREGARIAFGKPFETVLDVAKAKVIVTLDADILGTDGSVVKQSRGFADGRSLEDPAAMNRLYAIESTFSVTGSAADHRLRLKSRDVSAFAFALAAVPPLLLFFCYQHAATGSAFASAQQRYYALSDGPPDCFRYGFGAGIGCRGEHGEFVAHNLAGGYGLVAALGTTGRRMLHHVADVLNFAPLAALPLAALLARGRLIRILALAVAAQIAAYAPFYFDGSYPGGGARMFADALPLEHVLTVVGLVALAHRFRRRLGPDPFARATAITFALALAGFAVGRLGLADCATELADGNGHLFGLTVAPHRDRHPCAGGHVGHQGRELGRPGDGGAAKLGDHIAWLNARLFGGATRLHRADQGAHRFFHAKRLGQVRRDLLDGDPQTPSADFSVFQQLAFDLHRHINGNGKRQPLITTAVAVDLRVDANHFTAHIEQWATGVARIDRNIGLQKGNIAFVR